MLINTDWDHTESRCIIIIVVADRIDSDRSTGHLVDNIIVGQCSNHLVDSKFHLNCSSPGSNPIIDTAENSHSCCDIGNPVAVNYLRGSSPRIRNRHLRHLDSHHPRS
jgi:hypothetical protein